MNIIAFYTVTGWLMTLGIFAFWAIFIGAIEFIGFLSDKMANRVSRKKRRRRRRNAREWHRSFRSL